MIQLVKCLLYKLDPRSDPQNPHQKLAVVAQACTPSPGEWRQEDLWGMQAS